MKRVVIVLKTFFPVWERIHSGRGRGQSSKRRQEGVVGGLMFCGWTPAVSSVRRESMSALPGSATWQCVYNVEPATAVPGWLFVAHVPYNAHFVFVDDDIDHRVLVNVDS